MSEYVIVADSGCDLSAEYVSNTNLTVVPFYIAFEEEQYLKEHVDIHVREFYKQLVENPKVFPKTSMPTMADYYGIFEGFAKENKNIICITMSSNFSGCFNSASLAKTAIEEKYPDIKVAVIDSRLNTVTEGLLVQEAVKGKKANLDYDVLVKRLEDAKPSGRIYFTVSGLEYLLKGGRLGKVAQILKGIVKINAGICMKDGDIVSNGIAVSRKRALIKCRQSLKGFFSQDGVNIEDYNITVGYGYSIEEGEEFREKLATSLGIDKEKIGFEQIGATVACHTGPTPLGAGFIKKIEL